MSRERHLPWVVLGIVKKCRSVQVLAQLLHHRHAVPVLCVTELEQEANVERLTAAVVLALGSLVLLATVVSVALGHWETTLGKVLFLLLVLVGMWRALGHLPRP